jgi:FecR protein
MKGIIRAICITLACALLPIATAAAQSATSGCSLENSTFITQTLRCKGGLTIVIENGARYTLRDLDGNGRVDTVELGSKALLLEVPKKGRKEFKVLTPQAIAAVRGTKWAVDAVENHTSVFVVNGQVAVGRRAGRNSVILGPGEGVDVEAVGPLTVKRWPPARVAALMARLGQLSREWAAAISKLWLSSFWLGFGDCRLICALLWPPAISRPSRISNCASVAPSSTSPASATTIRSESVRWLPVLRKAQKDLWNCQNAKTPHANDEFLAANFLLDRLLQEIVRLQNYPRDLNLIREQTAQIVGRTAKFINLPR